MKESERLTSDRDGRRRNETLAISVTLLLVLSIFTLRCLGNFAGAGHDDTFITLFAARELAAGHGFVTPNGEPGEIGSSLIHVVVLALLDRLGIPDLYLANKVFGLLCGAGSLLLVIARRRSFFVGNQTVMPTLLATCLAACLPTYAFWIMGGLETPLVALLVTWLATEFLLSTPGASVRTGMCAALLALTRPEGFVYLGTVLAWGIATKRSRRWWVASFASPLLVFLLITAVRWGWLGSPVPLPVFAKAGGGNPFERIADGTSYVLAFAQASTLGMLVLCALGARWIQAGLQLASGRPPELLLRRMAPALVVSTQLSAAAIAGGDWMAYYRFIAPAVPLLCVSLVQMIWDVLDHVSSAPLLRRGIGGIGLCLIPWLVVERSGLRPPYMHNTCMQRSIFDLMDDQLGASLGERVRRLNHPYFRDETQLLPFLEGPLRRIVAQQRELTIATYQMGFFPYYLRGMRLGGVVHLVDTFGIVDPELARLPGLRTPLGLTIGLEPTIYLDPSTQDLGARAIQARRPDLVYVLRADGHTVEQLARWGWVLIWNAPEAKIFARDSVLQSDAASAR